MERGDVEAAIATLAPDVVFNSPVAHRPFTGREAVGEVLRAVFDTFEDFRYVAELEGDDRHALIFRARVGERELDGLDLFRPGPDGSIAELTVMVRPASGLMALGEAMGPKVAHLAKA